MQRELVIKGRSLGGTSDLTLLAPLKKGFVESLESVTYKTRTRRTLDALHGARMSSHEYAPVRLISDAVERVSAIHSVRVAVFEQTDMVMLAVTFDGSWESYIRVLWHKVGTLLDLIFCNTVGYVTAREHSFDDWEAWARRVQVETGFFYGPPDSTARDVLYHRRVERMLGRLGDAAQVPPPPAPPPDRTADLRVSLPSAEEQVQRFVDPPRPLKDDDPPYTPVLQSRMVRERVRSGVQGLAALYRLADLYRPGTDDGEVLRCAAIDLLDEFVRMRDNGLIDDELTDERDGPRDHEAVPVPPDGGRFRRQLDWLFRAGEPALQPRPAPTLSERQELPETLSADVQAGILRAYPAVNHGLVLLLAFDTPDAAAAFLEALAHPELAVTTDLDVRKLGAPGGDGVYRHVSFTAAGLRAVGLDEDELALFSEEFRQGMAARAGLLGDVHANHPRRWRLPPPHDAAAGAGVGMDSVHAVLQLRCQVDDQPARRDDSIPVVLQEEIDKLMHLLVPPRILAVQPLRRYYEQRDTRHDRVITEHFGYSDGEGQPEVEWKGEAGEFRRNRVPLGEVLLGHANVVEEALAARCPHVQQQQQRRLDWQRNGSYLVMRRYRQQVRRFEAAVRRTAEHMQQTFSPGDAKLDPWIELVKSKLMGRGTDGLSVMSGADPARVNAFTYDFDPQGLECPLHAHVRRAHPRARPEALVRPPRLMRRSMSFGPQVTPEERNGEATDPEPERGLLFMAYNASLGEQFEVVQRWLVGGNSTGSGSGTACPIVGTPQTGLARHFRFEHQKREFVVRLDEPTPWPGAPLPTVFDDADVTTRLDWGLYLFSPSIDALHRLRARSAAANRHAVPWQIEHGRAQLRRLRALEDTEGRAAALAAWKAAIEDPEAIDRLDGAALWAAIRADHGGLLRTPYGVLVAERGLAGDVYRDAHGRYSVSGQLDRMRSSFGEIALGLDDGERYRDLSTQINLAIGQLDPAQVSAAAFHAARRRLSFITTVGAMQSAKVGDLRYEIGFDVRELLDEVLATLSEDWFGLQDWPAADGAAPLRRGPTDWAWTPRDAPLYPGHFTALSRYMFQPNPGAMAVELGQAYGKSLREAMCRFVGFHRSVNGEGRGPLAPRREPPEASSSYAGQPAPLTAAVFNDQKHNQAVNADDLIARTLVGVLMGFNPTITGAVLNVLAEWQREGLFSALRQRVLALNPAGDVAALCALLDGPVREALRMRPMPQVGWRTALVDHRLGDDQRHAIDVKAGERVVMSIVSGTQQSLADGQDDGRLMFGGVREGAPGTYPTHACPGHAAGVAAVLGSLAGLLSWAELGCREMRPTTGPFSFVLEGDAPALTPPPPPPPASKDAAVGKLVSGTPLILAWGDSWLDFPHDFDGLLGSECIDIRDWLEAFGYEIPDTYCKYSVWPKSSTMAGRTGPFCAELDAQLLSSRRRPAAILLSAGGNDSTGDALRAILQNPTGGHLHNEQHLAEHVRAIGRNYRKVIDDLVAVMQHHDLKIPIVIHGYDNPVPQGKGIKNWPYARKWMYQPFSDTAKVDCATPAGLADGMATMEALIGALNDELRSLADQEQRTTVRHVDLRGTVQFVDKDHSDWADDLHPNAAAFRRLAIKVHEAIDVAVKSTRSSP